MKYLLLLPVVIFCCSGSHAQTVSVFSELSNFYQLSQLPAYRTNTTESQISTWDTTGGNNDGFGGQYSFVSRNADSSLVMIDVKGPGVINRIWTPTATEDTLDIYIDDVRHPVMSICYMDLFSGKVYPFVKPLCDHAAGGFYCYFPFPYQKQFKMVCRGKKLQFHQIGYRSFAAGTKVQRFDAKTDDRSRELLKKIALAYNEPGKRMGDLSDGTVQTATMHADLKPGATTELFHISKGATITGLELNIGGMADSNVYLKITWDNNKTPAIYCPIPDFFGYAFGKPAMQSMLLGSLPGGKHYCYLPMPFDSDAKIELEYKQAGGEASMNISGNVYYASRKRDKDHEGRLYCHYNKNRLEKDPQLHTFLNFSGKGHYIGTILQAQGFTPGSTPFFEGDDSTAIDGVFRMHGTGSEDYFNGGWYDLKGRWDTTRSLPLSGCLTYSHDLSRTGGYRFFLNDKLPFQKSIYTGIEHGPSPKETQTVEYTSLAFYYTE